MKKVLILLFSVINYSTFSQTSFEEIIYDLSPNKGKTILTTKYNKIGKYIIGKSDLNDLEKNKINSIVLKNNQNTEFSIITLKKNKNFNLFTIVSNEHKTIEKNIVLPCSFNFYLIFDKKTNNLFYIESENLGSIYRNNKSALIFRYDLKNIKQKIIKLNKEFIPIISFSNNDKEDSIKKNISNNYIISTYEFSNKISKVKNIKVKYLENSIFKINYVELIKTSNEIPITFDEIKECENTDCNIHILEYLKIRNL